MMTETLKDIALRVAAQFKGKAIYAVDDDILCDFVARLVEELGKQEAVAEVQSHPSGGYLIGFINKEAESLPCGTLLFAAPVIPADKGEQP